MEHAANQHVLREMSAVPPGRAVLLHGPAGSGKTAAALEVYRQYAPPGELPAARLLAPNETACETLKNRLREVWSGAMLAPGVMTFHALARRILAATGCTVRPIGAARQRLLLRRIVRDLHAEGHLPSLAAVHDAPGLIDSLLKTLAELKRATAEPEELLRRVGFSSGPAGDVLRIYHRYQQVLRETRQCDADGTLWLARDALRDRPAADPSSPGLPGLRTLIVDGFTDFTPTQMEILALLRRCLERLIVTLPLPAKDDGRERLWTWTRRTHHRLRKAFGGELHEIALSRAAEGPGGKIACALFRYEDALAPPAGLAILAAPGIEAEVREVGRRIKHLLAAKNHPMPRVAVLARDLSAYRPILDHVFAQLHLPIRRPARPLSEIPVIRFCFAVSDLGRTDTAGGQPMLSFSRIRGVLRSSYFRPEALGEFDAEIVAAAESLLRWGNVTGGREACAQAVERMLRQIGETAADDDESPPTVPCRFDAAAVRAAGALLEALFDLARRACVPAGLLAIPEAMGLRETIRRQDDLAVVARDLAALEMLRRTAENLSDLLDMDSPDDLDVFRDALKEVSLPGERSENLLDVLDVLDARAGRWDHVFLLGCDEGQFPRRFADSSLLGESDRRAWHDAGVSLDLRGDLTAREMLLFYLAVSRAEQSLTLSYRKTDAAGRPGAPGAFLQSLLDAMGGPDALKEQGVLSSPPLGQFLPPPENIATEEEALAAVVRSELVSDATPVPTVLREWVEAHLPHRLRRARLGAAVLQRRWTPPLGEFDGRLADETLRENFRQRMPETVFSAAQLGTYNQCPWQYFARYVLRLAPLETPQRQLQAVDLGLFCHDVLCDTMRELATKSPDRTVNLSEIPPEKLEAAFGCAFERQVRRVEERRPVYPALWKIQQEQWRNLLRNYLRSQQEDKCFRPRCLHFELSFGRGKAPAGKTDPASRAEPVEIEIPSENGAPAKRIRLCGRIDRVDRVHTDAGKGLFVVDYKTGRLPQRKEIASGQNVQIPLYAAALEKLLGEPAPGGAFHSLRDGKKTFFAAVKQHGQTLRLDGKYEEDRARSLAAVARAVEGIAEGRFDLHPADEKTCERCEYRYICHFSPSRQEYFRSGAKEAQP